MSFLLCDDDLKIHKSVDIVYAGIMSPITGMNSIELIAVEVLLPVRWYNNAMMIASITSPAMGSAKMGAPI